MRTATKPSIGESGVRKGILIFIFRTHQACPSKTCLFGGMFCFRTRTPGGYCFSMCNLGLSKLKVDITGQQQLNSKSVLLGWIVNEDNGIRLG